MLIKAKQNLASLVSLAPDAAEFYQITEIRSRTDLLWLINKKYFIARFRFF